MVNAWAMYLVITNYSIGITKVDEQFITSLLRSGGIVVFVVASIASDKTKDLCKVS
jgi:hypothetical protein